MGARRWLVSGVGYRLEESLEYRTLVPEALSIWRMAGANRMLFDCFDVDSKAARRSVAILSSCLRIECWGARCGAAGVELQRTRLAGAVERGLSGPGHLLA